MSLFSIARKLLIVCLVRPYPVMLVTTILQLFLINTKGTIVCSNYGFVVYLPRCLHSSMVFAAHF